MFFNEGFFEFFLNENFALQHFIDENFIKHPVKNYLKNPEKKIH